MTIHTPRRATVSSLFALGALALTTMAAAQSTLLIPALKTGDPIAGEPTATVTSVESGFIGAGGHIVAEIVGTAGLRALVLSHADTPGSHQVIARIGQSAPGLTGGAAFSAFEFVCPDATGRVVIKALLRQGGSEVITAENDRGYWLFDPATGQLTKLVREGEPAPNIANANFNFLNEESFSNGQLVFRTTLFNAGASITNGISIWTLPVSSPAPTPTLVARVGSASPVAGSVFRSFNRIFITPLGVIVFDGQIGPATGSSTDAVFRRSVAGALVHLLSAGGAAPGIPSASLSTLALQSVGPEANPIALAFLTGTSSDRALYQLFINSQSLLGRRDSVIPGTSPALTMSDFAFVGAGASGIVHFTTAVGGSGVTASNDRANILRTSSSHTLALREGDAAPELGGLVFGSINAANFSARTTTNASGVLLMQTTVLTGSTFAPVVYLFDPAAPAASRLKLLAGPNHPLIFSPSLTMQSSGVHTDNFGGTSEGRPRALNDRGEAVFTLDFGSTHSALMLFSPTAAASGACCIGATCQILSAAACTSPGRSFSGPGTVCNAPSNLTTPCCRADFDQSGILTPQDIFEFLNAWFQGSATADIDGANALQPADIFAFLNAWFAGC